MSKKKRTFKKKKTKLLFLFMILVVLLAGGIGGYFYVDSLAYKVCRVEAGINVSPADFMKDGSQEAFFTENSQRVDITVPGEYQIEVKDGWFSHKATLYIEDTIAPRAQAVSVDLEMGQTCNAEDLITDIVDATKVEVAFKEAPDFTIPGEQTVTILLTDRGNNVTEVEAQIFISQVIEEVAAEAGSAFPALSEFVIEAKEAKYITGVSDIDMSVLGDYRIEIEADGRVYEPVLHIIDTIAPTAEVADISGFALVERKPEDFVVAVEDVTQVAVSFLESPDLSMIGTQEVTLVFTDEGENETIKTAKLTLEADIEAPVITGAKDIVIYIGDTISYRRGVNTTDNNPDGLEFVIDNSGVNLNVAGVYPVTYTATDLAGNSTSVSITVTVHQRTYSEEEVNALADAVLARIITPEMEPIEKVQAIYNYNMSHIGYISHSDKGDWVKAAYEGLAEGKGDCYVYACTAKVLLTRAGIKNMDIEKIPARTMHYWNLVDIGDGWYHFDTTPRKDRPVIFMWTDEELMAYSAKHNNCHNYDHSLYPEVN